MGTRFTVSPHDRSFHLLIDETTPAPVTVTGFRPGPAKARLRAAKEGRVNGLTATCRGAERASARAERGRGPAEAEAVEIDLVEDDDELVLDITGPGVFDLVFTEGGT